MTNWWEGGKPDATTPLDDTVGIPASQAGVGVVVRPSMLGGGLTTLTLTYNGSDPFDVQAVVPLGYDPDAGGRISALFPTLAIFGVDNGYAFLTADVDATGDITALVIASFQDATSLYEVTAGSGSLKFQVTDVLTGAYANFTGVAPFGPGGAIAQLGVSSDFGAMQLNMASNISTGGPGLDIDVGSGSYLSIGKDTATNEGASLGSAFGSQMLHVHDDGSVSMQSDAWPTSDPHVIDVAWLDGDVVKLSRG